MQQVLQTQRPFASHSYCVLLNMCAHVKLISPVLELPPAPAIFALQLLQAIQVNSACLAIHCFREQSASYQALKSVADSKQFCKNYQHQL